MRPGYRRAALGLFLLLILIGLVSSPTTSDALAQRKGGGGQKDGRSREKDTAPPNLTLPESWAKAFSWRNIGPANMGGRITAIAMYEADPSTYWIATASGGLVKTANNGVTFEHQFDREGTVSIGDVCVAPSDRNVVWVGTGENNPRNSVSYGDGVYKSTDGGKTWKHMGLKKSHQTGKIAIHPTNPDVVYVGALGRCYGPNEERGLFKTTDGGKTWEKALYVDDKTGVIDIRLHPREPDTLYVATWERRRDEYDSWPGGGLPDGYDAYDPVKKWGPGSGIHKSTDGGKTFKKLTNGLPTNALGRIGLDVYPRDPNVVYAIIDCEKIGMGVPPKKAAIASNADIGARGEDAGEDAGAKVLVVFPDGPADKAGLRSEDVITKAGDKNIKSYSELLEYVRAQKVGDKVKVEIKRGEKTETIEVTLAERQAGKGGGGGGAGGGFGGPGGASATRPYAANYGGQAANVQDTQGPDGFQYGGVYRSADGGETWKRVNSVNPRPMYFSLFRVDPSDEKFQYVGGVSLSRSTDGGKTFQAAGRGVHADHHALWIDPKDGRHQIIGTDGGFYVTYDRGANWDHMNHLALGQFYHVAVCTKKPYWIYGGLQDNGSWGIPSMSLRGPGPVNEDVIPINGSDGYVCRVDPNDPDQIYYESQNGGMGRYNLRTGERASIKPQAPQGGPRYRFNWNTPHILSAHNSQIWYCGGNYVFKSVKKGDDAKVISPEITRTKHGSATALAESPRNPDVLWAGTDDGNLWVTRDGGKEWKNVAEKVGLKKPLWVATIEASRFAAGRAYVAFDAHRSDDDDPYVYMTDDYGDTWKPIKGNLPVGSSRCLREDVTNPNLLYCGTEFALFVSLDRGGSWTKINGNSLPTVAVHEVAVHPTAGEIVAATHGRSLWILDVTALRQMASEAVKEKPTLYKPNTLTRWQDMPGRGRSGRRFVGQNPPTQAQVYYSLPKKAEKAALRFHDIDGKKVGEMNVPTDAGLHKVQWDTVLRAEPVQAPMGGGLFGVRGQGAGGGGGGGGRLQGRAGGRMVPAGAYRVVLVIDGQEQASQSFAIEGDPHPGRSLSAEEEDEEEEEEMVKDR
jgi:photosystem II stability/assembly factor-like uncharacterized protein